MAAASTAACRVGSPSRHSLTMSRGPRSGLVTPGITVAPDHGGGGGRAPAARRIGLWPLGGGLPAGADRINPAPGGVEFIAAHGPQEGGPGGFPSQALL